MRQVQADNSRKAKERAALFRSPGELFRRCYACREGLTGKTTVERKPVYAWETDPDLDVHLGDDEEIVDYREVERVWECRCPTDPADDCFCPLCEDWFGGSAHLAEAIPAERVRWLANMVTHYRHEHRRSWRSQHRYLDRHATLPDAYENAKHRANEQIKRQIIRKAAKFLQTHGITPDHVAALQGTEAQTLELATAKLGEQAAAN